MDSIILCYQIKTIDKKRSIKEMGIINDDNFKQEVLKALCFQLGIK